MRDLCSTRAVKHTSKWLGLLALFVLVAFVADWRAQQHMVYLRNRNLEQGLLLAIVNEANASLANLQARYGGALRREAWEGREWYVLDAQAVAEESLTVQKEYTLGATDFYGYEFEFDEAGNLMQVGMYKP